MATQNDITDPIIIQKLMNGDFGVFTTSEVRDLVVPLAPPVGTDLGERIVADQQSEYSYVIAASTEQLVDLGVKRRYVAAVESLWPNPVAVVLPAPSRLGNTNIGQSVVAFYVPDGHKVRQLIHSAGPLLVLGLGSAPANALQLDVGEPSFHCQTTAEDWPVPTIVRIFDDELDILRPGVMDKAQIDAQLNATQ